MPIEGSVLISMPEIAELAGVQRPVVTVWRRRYNGSFPRPVGGDAGRPLFDAQAILDWLVATGRANRETLEPDLRQYALWHLGTQMKPEDLIAFATALICLRGLDGDEPLQSGTGWARVLAERASRVDPSDLLLLSEINALPDDAAWLVQAIDELVDAAWGCRQAFERLFATRNRLNVPTLYRDAISPDLAKFMAAISGASEQAAAYGTVIVVDPWAGSGDLLSAVVAAIGEKGQPSISAVTSGALSRLLRRRMRLWELPAADIDVRTQSRPPANMAWQVLVTALPYRPQENRSRERQLRFLARLATDLGPGQAAVVLGPADLLAEQMPPTQAGIRSEILRTDAVEAIITLPGGLMPFRPGYQAGLWVLRRDESGRGQGRVLHADVSDRPLTAQVVNDLVEDVTTWRREGYHPAAHRRALTTPVRVADLLSGHSTLRGLRVPELPEANTLRHSRVALLLDLQTQLAEHAQQPLPPPLTANIAAREDEARPTVTIGTLIKKEQVKRLKGARIAAEHVAGVGHHRVIGIPELTGQARPGHRMIDRLVLAERYPHVRLTEPGDVIIAITSDVMALVDIDGFSIAEYPAAVLRVNSEGQKLTPRTLVALIGSAPSGRARGAVRSRRLDEIPVPVLEPDEVGALDELLIDLDQRRRRAQEEIDTLDTLRRTAVTGIADGTLTITPNHP
jgi:predicted DNA-binding transcriptional regulator AlpA